MTWLTPLTGVLVAALVIPPLIILYFLKLRRRPQAISCTLLWKKSVEDLQANAPFQKLRKSLLLLLQLLILILLAVALMQPQIQAGQRDGGRTIIIIDNSASMAATDMPDDRSRLRHARDEAKNLIERLHGGGVFATSAGETMIIAFNKSAEIVSRFTGSKNQLLAALDRIGPVDTETRLDDALKLARAYTINPNPDKPNLSLGEPAVIELFSDGRIHDIADQVKREDVWNYHPYGSSDADNVAITTIAVERPYDRPTQVEVFAALANFNLQAVTCDVQLSVDDVVLYVMAVEVSAAEIDQSTRVLKPGRRNVVFTPFEQPSGAVIGVENIRLDDLDADNTAQLVVPPPKQLRVAVVSPKSYLLRSALEGLPLESLIILSEANFESLIEEAGGIDQYDVVVLDNYAPSQLPPGRYLTFGKTPPVEGLNEYGTGEAQMILDVRSEQPSMRFVQLDNLYIANYTKLRPADDVLVLAEGTDTPAIVRLSRGKVELIHVAFDYLDSNWPFERSFVNFLFNSIEALGQAGRGIASQGLTPGQAITARLPSGASNIEMLLPDGSTQELQPADPTAVSWGPIRRSGVHVLSWDAPDEDGRQTQAFATNLLSDAEGDIAPAVTLLFGEEIVAGEIGDRSRYTSLWPWAIGLALGVMMLEWWFYHRKVMV